MLAAAGLSPWYLVAGAGLAFVVAVAMMQRPTAGSVILDTAQQARDEAVGRLVETQSMLRAIIDNTMAAIVVKDLEGRYLLANRTWSDIVGLTGDVEGHTDDGVGTAEEIAAWRTNDRLAREGPLRVEESLTRDGRQRYFDVTKFPLHDRHDEVYATCTVGLDITDRRTAAEDLERSNHELERFAFVASHDLREPLRTAAGYAELIERRHGGALDEQGISYLREILTATRRMTDLVDGLLAMSRAQAERVEMQPFALGPLVDEVSRELSVLRRERDAQIVAVDLPEVYGDRAQVHRVLQNLVVNAIRYVAEGVAPRVEVSARRVDGGHEVAVADNGVGIAPEHAERIFEMFFRDSSRDTGAGSGLGLAVCRRIAERHGGRIWVEPGEGGGSTFRFTLPDRRDSA